MKIRRTIATISAAAFLALASAGTATAAESKAPKAPQTETTVGAMNVVGYDRMIAARHGYRVMTNADGTEYSVAVTPAAKKEAKAAAAAQAAANGEVSALGTVTGNCGSSFISSAKLSNNTLAVNTGYTVYNRVVDKKWSVSAVGFVTADWINFSGSGTGPSWSAQSYGTVIGPGVAGVTGGSFARLVDGRVCYSGIPTSTFK